MSQREIIVLLGVLLGSAGGVRPSAAAPSAGHGELDRRFMGTVRPFLEGYCLRCHGPDKPKAQLDLSAYSSREVVVRDQRVWATVLERLSAKDMPPAKAEQPPPETRQKVVDWVAAVQKAEARRNAGDPGVVLARRLSNAEYNYTIRDLTGVDLRPTREFPVDPANPAGFDNTGESLVMSPALLNKYVQAARDVANHLVLEPGGGIAFAPHPMLVETDRDKYCVQRIVDFYRRQPTDHGAYFQAAWKYKHRAGLGRGGASLNAVAAAEQVSGRYLALVWKTLEDRSETVGPVARLQGLWRAVPGPGPGRVVPAAAARGLEAMKTFVVELRRKIEPRFEGLSVNGLRGTAQPLLMWKNRQYASHRMDYDRKALQVGGEAPVKALAVVAARKDPDEADEDEPSAPAVVRGADEADLKVPAGQRARYEAAFARFASVFPDAFYVAERGRNYLDKSKDRGRYLSAGFHNLMGYFRDDQPLSALILDEKGRAELDELWQELDFVAAANIRTFVQFYLSESGEARKAKGAAADRAITDEVTIKRVADSYLDRARKSGNPVVVKAVEEHFTAVNAGIRWVEKTRAEAAPRHLAALEAFAARAYRRPLAPGEREELGAYYRSLREKGGLEHEEAMRDLVVSVLMSPDFCYRIDLPTAGQLRLSDQALASRLSYFLWSSMPDAELLARAAAGDLHRPEVMAAQARRMLKDPRARGLATEFGGNWLDFRRFEQHNAVDRGRFPSFDDGLRQAMFEEPIRFLDDVIRNDRSVKDFLYGDYTFVNATLARHYGLDVATSAPDQWVRVPGVRKVGRGGLLPMAVFLTQNAPGLRTSPVKRGYWVVRRVLGEQIPPPPAVVPELPHDEAELDLPLRQVLARHREDPSCAGCHARFDAMGLVFEGYGPIGERRTKDLGGRAVETRAAFPGGSEGAGLEGLTRYVRAHREGDFSDNLCRKLLGYALGRSLQLWDEPTVERMRAALAGRGFRFGALVETIVKSPQFLNKKPGEIHASN